MSENQNNNSVLIDSKQTLMPLKEHTKPTVFEGQNNAENNKRTREQPATNKIEGRPLTRQLKEAGAATYTDQVVISHPKTEGQGVGGCDQTNKFKPVNESSAGANIGSEEKLNTKATSSDAEGSHDNSKKPGLTKSRSFGDSHSKLRERCPRNSTRNTASALQASKSVEDPANLAGNEEILVNNGTKSSVSLTAPTGEDTANKRKNDARAVQKSSRNLPNSKNKDEKSANEASEKSEGEVNNQGLNRKTAGRREEICVEWIKNLQELESELNMEPEQDLSDEEVPEFCSNKTCPISEHKITKTPKVLKQSKRVILRKALFDNDDERWYCLKCLKAHNDSLFCFHCGQIYFMDESELEDDGKAWICCDKCDKWIHLDCDIFKGKNTMLQENYKDKNFSYACPECREPKKLRRRNVKDMRKRSRVQIKRENSNTHKRKCVENNSSCYSNSMDNESHKHKNVDIPEDVQMANDVSQIDEEMADASFVSQTEKDKKSISELDCDSYSQTPDEGRKRDTRKRNALKKSKGKNDRLKVQNKRNVQEYNPASFRRDSESVEDFTRYRSMKIAREREDIVESRSLGLKVSLFCGLTQPQILERIQQDIESISNAITSNEKSESDMLSNSPQKDSDKDNRSCRDGSSLRNGNGATNTRRLRTRRARNGQHHQY